MARLVVNPGTPTAWEIQLKPGSNTIGRGFANDIKITDPSVSGSHCQINVDNSNVTIKDLGSTNGTYINRAAVLEAPLLPGQTIHLGGVEMLFHLDGAGPTPVRLTPPAQGTVSIVAPPPPSRAVPVAAPPPVPLAPPATVTGSQNCKFHPKTAGRYFCHQCQLPFCELCVTTRPVGETAHKFCRRCGAECAPIQVQAPRPSSPQSFYQRLPSALIYPSRGSGVFVLIICSLVIFGLNFMSRGVFGLIMWMIFIGYLFSFMQTIIHSTAAGDQEMPGFPPFDGLFGCFFRLAGAVLTAFGPALAFTLFAFFSEESSAAPALIIPAVAFGCFYFPMALLAVAMKDTPLAANPLVVVPAIFKAPLEYLLTVILLGVIVVLYSLGGGIIDSIFPRGLRTHSMPKLFGFLGSWAFWNFVQVYLLAVTMRILGLLYLSKKQKLGWFAH